MINNMSKPTLYSDNSKSKSFFETLQQLTAKHLSRSYGGDEPIVFEFTQDRALLHQYYLLREKMYQKVHHIPFNGDEDLYDKLSYVLIARKGRLCLGGCRLTIREGDEKWSMPLETQGFNLRGAFSDLPLNSVRHGEISRFAVMDDTGKEDIFYGLCKVMYDKVIESGVHYLFAKSPYVLARNWRMVANSFGVKTTRICSEIALPEDPELPEFKWYTILSDLTSLITDSKHTNAGVMADEAPKIAANTALNHLSLVE